MPDDKIVVGDVIKEKDEFDSTLDELFAEDAKSDEEILKDKEEADKKKAEADAASGDATKDQSGTSDDDPSKSKDDDMFSSGQLSTEEAAKVAADAAAAQAATKTNDGPAVTELETKITSLEDELSKERQKTSSWSGRISAANDKVKVLEAEVAELKAKKTVDPEADKQIASDKEVLEKFRTDFPELGDVVDVLVKRVEKAEKAVTSTSKEPTPDPAKIPEASPPVNPETGKTKHMETITEIHPDLSEMVDTGVLKTWINKQKSFLQPHLETIYKEGNSTQIIEMVTQFKDSTGWKSQLKTEDTTKQDKLKSMLEINSETGTPNSKTVDKNDYAQAAKDAGL